MKKKIPLDIDSGVRSVGDSQKLRDEWADVCLKLAEAFNWDKVRYKPGHYVVAGHYGWFLFCARANLTTLRDQVYPALIEAINWKGTEKEVQE